jgi:hypothetical protein
MKCSVATALSQVLVEQAVAAREVKGREVVLLRVEVRVAEEAVVEVAAVVEVVA